MGVGVHIQQGVDKNESLLTRPQKQVADHFCVLRLRAIDTLAVVTGKAPLLGGCWAQAPCSRARVAKNRNVILHASRLHC